MTHKLSSDGAAVVTQQAHWLPIDSKTPRGVKMMLISEAAGVAQIGLHLASGRTLLTGTRCQSLGGIDDDSNRIPATTRTP